MENFKATIQAMSVINEGLGNDLFEVYNQTMEAFPEMEMCPEMEDKKETDLVLYDTLKVKMEYLDELERELELTSQRKEEWKLSKLRSSIKKVEEELEGYSSEMEEFFPDF